MMPGRAERPAGHVVALSGGIGGAKLALGLSLVLPKASLTVVANTGDDFEHLGLSISPDLDTLLYTLARINDPARGWGRRGETWNFMRSLEVLGGPAWFRLGDKDLATHVERTRRLMAGDSLSAITDDFRRRLRIDCQLLPMSDDAVRTKVRTSDGWLAFQDYFVRLRCEPGVREIAFEGAADARVQPQVLAALRDPDLRAIVVCPSNPLISIDPILALPGMRESLSGARAPVIGVSPIVGGKAIKGPSAKMMQELGCEVSARGVASRYGDFLDGYVIDAIDSSVIPDLQVPAVATATVMTSLQDRIALAKTILAFADRLRASDHARSPAQ